MLTQPLSDTMAPKATADKKHNQVIAMLQTLQASHDETKQLLADSLAKVTALETKVFDLEKCLSKQGKEILDLKNQVNNRDIASRGSSVRLVGLPVEDDETRSVDGGKTFLNRVFKKVVKPILVVAKAKGEITQVPSAANTIESTYRVGKHSAGACPPSIIINFVSKQLRLAVLRHKKGNIPSCGDDQARPFIGEDLTAPTHRMMKMLNADERVFRVWSIEGRLRYTLRSDPSTVLSIKSVFEPVAAFLK